MNTKLNATEFTNLSNGNESNPKQVFKINENSNSQLILRKVMKRDKVS